MALSPRAGPRRLATGCAHKVRVWEGCSRLAIGRILGIVGGCQSSDQTAAPGVIDRGRSPAPVHRPHTGLSQRNSELVSWGSGWGAPEPSSPSSPSSPSNLGSITREMSTEPMADGPDHVDQADRRRRRLNLPMMAPASAAGVFFILVFYFLVGPRFCHAFRTTHRPGRLAIQTRPVLSSEPACRRRATGDAITRTPGPVSRVANTGTACPRDHGRASSALPGRARRGMLLMEN